MLFNITLLSDFQEQKYWVILNVWIQYIYSDLLSDMSISDRLHNLLDDIEI